MSLAEHCLAVPRKRPFAQHAKSYGATAVDTLDEGMTFYFFADGSRIGTKGRGKGWQVWVLLPLEAA